MIALLFLGWLFGVVALVAAIRAEECWFGAQHDRFRQLQNFCTVLSVLSLSFSLISAAARMLWP
jgi:hypothetical protein